MTQNLETNKGAAEPLVAHGDILRNLSSLSAVRLAAGLTSAAIIIAGLFFGQEILIPLAVAFLISFALSPAIAKLERIGLSRLPAVILTIVIVVILLGGFGLVLGSQLRALSQELPTYQSTIRSKLADLRKNLSGPGILDGALQTVDTVQKEVESPATHTGDAPQRVSVVPAPPTPFDTAKAWLVPALAPLANAGIIFVFVFLMLVDRSDLRMRLLRLLGGNLHRSTDALEEAGTRISKYLLMQLLVNVTYGLPMGVGLWLIGVPGALLWGTVAAVMRFIPYIGPMISAVFPLGLAFAVDPGWNMVLWTLGLIIVLEVISNNVVEPLLYGSSTGLSAISLIVSATFWTALWGPAGLVLSTPLTVCLLVVGRNLPQLQFLDTLLGTTPALDLPTRIYQRLLANDPDESIDIANVEIERSSVQAFYSDVAVPVLALASQDYQNQATPEHHLRVINGMEALIEDLRETYTPDTGKRSTSCVICVAGKWEVDTLAADMLAHALCLAGTGADFRPASALTSRHLDELKLDDADIVVLGYLSEQPIAAARQLCRRVRRKWPRLRIVLALLNVPDSFSAEDARNATGADELATSVNEAVERVGIMLSPARSETAMLAETGDDMAWIAPLLSACAASESMRDDLDALAKKTADAFGVGLAVVAIIDARNEYVVGQSKPLPDIPSGPAPTVATIAREDGIGYHAVQQGTPIAIPDVRREPSLADHRISGTLHSRFYAAAPLVTSDNRVFGALCILDDAPREITGRDKELLGRLADEATFLITGQSTDTAEVPARARPETATVGQKVPE